MASEVLISELLDLPDQVHRGDFVLNLSEGVTPGKAERTLADYVVTPQLADAFDNALGFIKAALDTRGSKAAYLHGSFGSGKSHFMAVLHLLLQHDPRARAHEGLENVCVKQDWVRGKKFLLVPYHMINARSMESAILGGYADYVREHHPEVPWPGIYLADDLFDDARRYRENVGDEKFFALLGTASADAKWGKRAVAWDPARFEAALAAPPGDEGRGKLVGDLVKHLFQGYAGVSAGKSESFLSLDKGLSVISRHARDLGYDGLILFLDELILWLASHAARPDFVHQEGQKLAKLVESQTPDQADPDRQLRRPPARPPRPRRQERPGRRPAQLRRRPPPLGRPVPHDRPGGPQSPADRREAGPEAEGGREQGRAEAGLRAGDQGPARDHADPADPRRRPRDVPDGLSRSARPWSRRSWPSPASSSASGRR